ncbi:MAG: hypothetical protein ABSB34_03170 [Candidatus Limnocylindrales bacterium]|jgi:hypothetical protein
MKTRVMAEITDSSAVSTRLDAPRPRAVEEGLDVGEASVSLGQVLRKRLENRILPRHIGPLI